MITPHTAWERDGYAILRGFASPAEVEGLRQGFAALEARATSLEETADVGTSRFVLTEGGALHRVVWCEGAEPRFAHWGRDPRFLDLACALLGTNHAVQLIQQAHFKLPGDGVAFSWHQDASNRRYSSPQWTDVTGTGSYVQMALAIDPMTAENGPLRVLPESHRLGFVAHPDTGALPADLSFDHAIDVLLEPGDLVVFGPFLVHGSPPNRSSAARRLFLQGYAAPGANGREYPGSGRGVTRERAPRS
jgi:ectoine hydroxylase-related dioxygenase (phytanoyl-CoA dioxygenase family)